MYYKDHSRGDEPRSQCMMISYMRCQSMDIYCSQIQSVVTFSQLNKHAESFGRSRVHTQSACNFRFGGQRLSISLYFNHHILQVCQKKEMKDLIYSTRDGHRSLFSSYKHLLYCPILKAGSTNILRLLCWLYGPPCSTIEKLYPHNMVPG